jgi:hypothetical protein
LKQAIDTISQDLLQQYTLAYYSSNPAKDSAYRHIEVKVNRRGAKIRARNGYRLPGDSEETTQAATIKTIALPPDAPSRPQIKPFETNLEHEEGRLIYRDHFSDPASGWPNRSGFFYDRGEYHITKAGSAVADGPWLKDLRASLTVRPSAGTSKKDHSQEIVFIGPITPGVSPIQIKESLPGAGLVFRLDELGYYAFLISGSSASQRAYFKLIRKDIKSGTATEVIPGTVESAPAPAGAGASQRKLSVNCQGDFIQLYISDKLVGCVHDDHLKDGMAGMILFGQDQAFFDDLFVEELP